MFQKGQSSGEVLENQLFHPLRSSRWWNWLKVLLFYIFIFTLFFFLPLSFPCSAATLHCSLSPQHRAVSLPITSTPGAMLGKCISDLVHAWFRHHGPVCLWSIYNLSVSQAAAVHLWRATLESLQAHNWVLCCGRTLSLNVPLSFYPTQSCSLPLVDWGIVIARILTVLEQWACLGVALWEAEFGKARSAEDQHQTNTSAPIKSNKQFIQVVISLCQYFLQITSYQHAPKLA